MGPSGVRAGGDAQGSASSLLRGAWRATIHSPQPPPDESHAVTLDFLLVFPPFKILSFVLILFN